MTFEQIAKKICEGYVPGRFDTYFEHFSRFVDCFPVVHNGAYGYTWKNYGIINRVVTPQEGNALQQLSMYVHLDRLLPQAVKWATTQDPELKPIIDFSFAQDRPLYAIIDFPVFMAPKEVAKLYGYWHERGGPLIKPERQRGLYWESMPPPISNTALLLHNLRRGNAFSTEESFEQYLSCIRTIVDTGYAVLKKLEGIETGRTWPKYELLTEDADATQLKVGDHIFSYVKETGGYSGPIQGRIERINKKNSNLEFEILCTDEYKSTYAHGQKRIYITDLILWKLVGIE